MHGKSHVVERLPVHLPQSQYVQFEVGNEEERLSKALASNTKLEAWFALNAAASQSNEPWAHVALSTRYPDVPSYFTWDAKSHIWKPRARAARHGSVVGRMMHVKPGCGELYFLRLLLLHLPGSGATGWQSLQSSAAPHAEATFQNRARELGLLHDDSETLAMLRESVTGTFDL